MMETPKPNWIDELEQRLDHIKGFHQLGHEIGAGSKCLKCGDACPGLELHFWRKQCRNCKCKKEDHDVPPNDDGRLRFEILIKGTCTTRNKSLKRVLEMNLPTELKASGPKSLKFDWAPPVSNELAAEYMQLLPSSKIPISGSVGANYRNKQLDYQIPLQDISPNVHLLTSSEGKTQFENYLQNLRDNVVGQGIVERVCDQNKSTRITTEAPLQVEKTVGRDQLSDHATDKENANTAKCDEDFPTILNQKLKNATINNINNPSESSKSLCGDLSGPIQTPYFNKGPVPFQKYKEDNSATAAVPSPDDYNYNKRPALFDGRWGVGSGGGGGVGTERCQRCGEAMGSGTVAVVTDRAGRKAAWHPNCFICCVCQELLVDLVYFYHDKKIYCGRHYAEINSIPRCFACDELIFVSQYTVADDKPYHLEHFCCADCDTELAGNQFLVLEGSVYCLPCYHDNHAKKCGTCGERIGATEEGMHLVGAKQHLHWHRRAACFRCSRATCLQPLIGRRFVLHDDRPFCDADCKRLHSARDVPFS